MAKKATTLLELRAKAIKACADRSGRVHPDTVVAAARNPKSVLHSCFQWDIQKAAEAHWRDTARSLIKEVRLQIVFEDVKISAPYYVADQSQDETGYIETMRIARRGAAARAQLEDELSRVKGALSRGRSLAKVFGLASHFERMLDIAVEAERAFEDAARDDRPAA